MLMIADNSLHIDHTAVELPFRIDPMSASEIPDIKACHNGRERR